jgi:hypothetical protein
MVVASTWLPQLPLEGDGDGKRGSRAKKGGKAAKARPLLPRHERLYLWGLVAVEVATSWVLPPLLKQRLPFLPLMAVSLYCSLGMMYCWVKLGQRCW